MHLTDAIALLALGVSAVTAGISIPLAIRADRRSKTADVPVVNVFIQPSRFQGWAYLRVVIDNKTPGHWSVNQISLPHEPNMRFANANWIMTLSDDWTPEANSVVGSFPVGKEIKAGAVEDLQIYASSTSDAVPSASRTSVPRFVQAITRRFSKRALRISLTKHAWSLERHELHVKIAVPI